MPQQGERPGLGKVLVLGRWPKANLRQESFDTSLLLRIQSRMCLLPPGEGLILQREKHVTADLLACLAAPSQPVHIGRVIVG